MRSNFCAVSRDLAVYEWELDRAEAIQKIQDELYVGDYSPTQLDNLLEALDNHDSAKDMAEFSKALAAEDVAEIGSSALYISRQYWTLRAEKRALEIFEEQENSARDYALED